MTTIYLVRHAEAEGNVYRRCHGQYDALLTPRAYQQLPYVAERFAKKKLDAVYASDLFRARKTAEAIAAPHGLSVETRPVLREIDMGDWEDLPWAELPVFWQAEYDKWRARPWDSRPPHGESVLGAGERLLGGLRCLAQENPNRTIAVASHGSAIRGLLTLVHGYEGEQMNLLPWCDNTGVAKLLFAEDGAAQIAYENDASHLPDALSTFHAIGWKKGETAPATPQIWFRRADPLDAADAAQIVAFMREFYRSAYGSDERFDADAYLLAVQEMQRISPRAACFGITEQGELAAYVCMDVRQQKDEGETGLVGAFCLAPDWRGRGLSGQILGQAISVYRELGKKWLCARVAEGNERAKGFYHKYVFEQRGIFKNENGRHFEMYKKISVE